MDGIPCAFPILNSRFQVVAGAGDFLYLCRQKIILMKIVRFFLAIGMAWAILQMVNYQQNGRTELLEWEGWRPFLWCVLILVGVKVAWYFFITRPRRGREEKGE
jgi:hypothetical protein